MNIFALDANPELAAQYHHDKHVVKMILETAQILSTVHHIFGTHLAPHVYKPTHAKHPCVLWAAASKLNYDWLGKLGKALCEEYTHRYNKDHKSSIIISYAITYPPFSKEGKLLYHPLCMPNKYKCVDPIQSYRNYYIGEKLQQSKYTNRKPPYWIN